MGKCKPVKKPRKPQIKKRKNLPAKKDLMSIGILETLNGVHNYHSRKDYIIQNALECLERAYSNGCMRRIKQQEAYLDSVEKLPDDF